jgi:hypothetical protein
MKLILLRKNVVDWAHAGDALVTSAEKEKKEKHVTRTVWLVKGLLTMGPCP